MEFKKYRSGLLIIVYIAFGVYCFVLGDNGILERIKLIQGRQEIADNIFRLEKENKSLRKEYEIISNDNINNDVYEKEASESGYIKPGDKYIFFKNEKSRDIGKSAKSEPEKYSVKLSHLRILWGIGFIMIVLLYLARKRKIKEREEI